MADTGEPHGDGRRRAKDEPRPRDGAPAGGGAEWHTAGLWEILQPRGGRPIALVGAGGKSAAIARLITEWRDRARDGAPRDGAPRNTGFIATVTTRLKAEQASVADRVVYTSGSPDLPTVRAGEVLLVAGQPAPGAGKIDGIAAETVCDLAARHPDTPIVVEADGAAGALVKVPGAHEPVIPRCAAAVVAVTGFPALARPPDRHTIHRYSRFVELFGESVTVLSADIVAGLLVHPDGSFRGAPAGARRYWVINQVAGADAFRRARQFADQVCARLNGVIDGIIVGALQSDRPLMYRSVTRNTEEM